MCELTEQEEQEYTQRHREWLKGAPYCSFCATSHKESTNMIEGPSVAICERCFLIVAEQLGYIVTKRPPA